MGYRRLEVYQLSHRLAVEVHRMTLSLPKIETYEEASQIRRSAKSVPAQIVEGYCLRKNKNEFVQYLNRAYASAHETVEHLDLLFETTSLKDEELYRNLRGQYDTLCKMIFRFLQGVMERHERPPFVKEEPASYEPDLPSFHISHPTSE